MSHSIIGVFNCIEELKNSIDHLINEGVQTGDLTLITKEKVNQFLQNIPVIQVAGQTDTSLWETIAEFFASESASDELETAVKNSFSAAAKYVLLIETMLNSASDDKPADFNYAG